MHEHSRTATLATLRTTAQGNEYCCCSSSSECNHLGVVIVRCTECGHVGSIVSHVQCYTAVGMGVKDALNRCACVCWADGIGPMKR
eukprot:14445-Heterococcus_DN1.PRE.1